MPRSVASTHYPLEQLRVSLTNVPEEEAPGKGPAPDRRPPYLTAAGAMLAPVEPLVFDLVKTNMNS
jgi:hypothetical protein